MTDRLQTIERTVWGGFLVLTAGLVGLWAIRDPGDSSELRLELADLSRRFDGLEDRVALVEERSTRPAQRGAVNPLASRVPAEPAVAGPAGAGSAGAESTAAGAPAEEREVARSPMKGLSQLGALVQTLETRVANLESAAREQKARAKSLVAPDAIPAALAVLLATRGVVTKVGDVEALQANMPTLAALVGDPQEGEWERIEAYRGMLMFGFQRADLCTEATTGMASIVRTSADAKARRAAAGLLQNYKNPAIASSLMASYQRETDLETRGAIVSALLNLRSDPGVTTMLAGAAKTEGDAKLRARLQRALK